MQMLIYVVLFGKITVYEKVRLTEKGVRVRTLDSGVYLFKQNEKVYSHMGIFSKDYFTQKVTLCKNQAIEFATTQIQSLEKYHYSELEKLKQKQEALYVTAHQGTN